MDENEKQQAMADMPPTDRLAFLALERFVAAVERVAAAMEATNAMDEDARRGYQQMLLGHNQ